MKTLKHAKTSFGIAGIVLLLFFGGCQKENPSDSESTTIDKGRVLKEGTGLKVTIKGDTNPRVSKLSLKSIDKIQSILNQNNLNNK